MRCFPVSLFSGKVVGGGGGEKHAKNPKKEWGSGVKSNYNHYKL